MAYAQAIAADFPREDSLCEACGYPLRGVSTDACPECGAAVADSSPTRRTGLPWQRRWRLSSYVATVAAMATSPRWAFGRMSLGDPAWNGRLFLLANACVAGGVWLGLDLVWTARHAFWAWAVAMATVKAVIVLTYLEVLGLSFFCKRRGWRMPLARAERVGCYASVGWVPAVALLAGVHALEQRGWLSGLWSGVASPLGARAIELGMLTAAAGIAMLWFEWLSWLGARRVRFANVAEPATPLSPGAADGGAPQIRETPRRHGV